MLDLEKSKKMVDKLSEELEALKEVSKAKEGLFLAAVSEKDHLYQQLFKTIDKSDAAHQQLRASDQQLRAANQQLRASEQQLRVADQAKDQFLANMSHELRTPLNAIIGFTDFLLEDNTLNPGQKKDTERISVNAQHLIRLIDDILDLAKIEAGKIKLAKEMVDIAPLIGKWKV